MHISTASHNEVSSNVSICNSSDTNKDKIGFIKLCKETTRQHTDVAKLGEIYF